MAFRFTPKHLEHISEADLKAYLETCAQTIERNGLALERARKDVERLAHARMWSAIDAYGGIAVYGAGLLTTAITGGLGAAISVAGGLFAARGLNAHYRKQIERSLLRIEIEDIEASDAFCRAEQLRIRDELLRRRLA